MNAVVSTPGSMIGRSSEHLEISVKGKVVRRMAVRDLRSITVIGQGIAISTAAIDLCSRFGVPIHTLSKTCRPMARIVMASMVGTANTRQSQYRVREEGGIEATRICCWLIRGRLNNNLNTARYFTRSRPHLQAALGQLEDQTERARRDLGELELASSADLMRLRPSLLQIEGNAASSYWQVLAQVMPAELHFPGREYRGTSDVLNMCLNYGYGILYSHTAGALDLAGLDPFAGFLHVDRPGRESLVLDVCELFRSMWIDRALLSRLGKGWRPQVEDDKLDQTTREAVAESVLRRLDHRLKHQGKTYRLQNLLVVQSRHLGSYLRDPRQALPDLVAPA